MSNSDICECIGGGKIEPRTKEALERAYISLQRIVTDLYAEVDNAVEMGNYNDARKASISSRSALRNGREPGNSH
jgi:hypothetical protein